MRKVFGGFGKKSCVSTGVRTPGNTCVTDRHDMTVALNPNTTNQSKVKEFADDNFKFDENDKKFSKWVEDTVGKGEIACYEQFLLFPQCFLKTCIADM